MMPYKYMSSLQSLTSHAHRFINSNNPGQSSHLLYRSSYSRCPPTPSLFHNPWHQPSEFLATLATDKPCIELTLRLSVLKTVFSCAFSHLYSSWILALNHSSLYCCLSVDVSQLCAELAPGTTLSPAVTQAGVGSL